MSIFPPLGLHFKSRSHPWEPQTLHSTLNEMIGTYKKFIQYDGRVKVPTLETVVDVKIPTHVRFTKYNSRGLPAPRPPILGQTRLTSKPTTGGFRILSHFCEHGDDLLIIEVGHRVLIRTISLQQDRFRKLKWLPSSAAFAGARVIASGSLTKIT